MNIHPLTVSPSTSAHTITATQFTNGTTTIVELVPKPLQAITDSLMAMRGLHRTTHRPVGWAPPQPVGFIHWVAINHPQNMPNMLKYLRELSWAEHNVVTNPVKVKIRLQKSIDDIIVVAPHCAPAFIMELAHYFAAEKKSSFVKPYLNLIHKLEKTHNLPIDYDQRMTYFVEFAGCKKVVTGNIMWMEAENLVAQGFTPQQIIDYLAQIITAATRHDNVLYDIRWRLGYSKELSGDSVDNIMLKAVFSVQKLLPQAIGHFRETENAQSIRKFIRENREYQEQLIAAQPWGWETDGRNSPATHADLRNGYSTISPAPAHAHVPGLLTPSNRAEAASTA